MPLANATARFLHLACPFMGSRYLRDVLGVTHRAHRVPLYHRAHGLPNGLARALLQSLGPHVYLYTNTATWQCAAEAGHLEVVEYLVNVLPPASGDDLRHVAADATSDERIQLAVLQPPLTPSNGHLFPHKFKLACVAVVRSDLLPRVH